MNILEFIIKLLYLISIDVIVGFILYVLYTYFDKKYMSQLEINILKEEGVKFWQLNNAIFVMKRTCITARLGLLE